MKEQAHSVNHSLTGFENLPFAGGSDQTRESRNLYNDHFSARVSPHGSAEAAAESPTDAKSVSTFAPTEIPASSLYPPLRPSKVKIK